MVSDPLSLRLLRYLPKNLISRAFGKIARLERPRFLVRRLNRYFANHYGVDLDAASRPLSDYASLMAFFTRELKPGLREIAPGAELLVNPVDGRLGISGRIEEGRLLQAKGLPYSLAALLGSEAAARPFQDGRFLTLYLAPRDYHRIHSPVAGEIRATLYEPGTLWPVNPPAVARIPSLFAVNERVTCWIETQNGPVAVVLVGATNVGSIRLAYHDFATNRGAARARFEHEPPIPIEPGDPLGTFELGSTVILLVGHPDFRFDDDLEPEQWRPMGARLGRYPD